MARYNLPQAIAEAESQGATQYDSHVENDLRVFRPRYRRRFLFFGERRLFRWEEQVYQRDSYSFDEPIWFVIYSWHPIRWSMKEHEYYTVDGRFAPLTKHPERAASHERLDD